MENPWIPSQVKDKLTDKQAEFLMYTGREALFGGAAGGGKSVALLLAALQFVDRAGYSALILRRTFKQLAKADSILNKSKEWLMPQRNARGVRWNGDTYTWTFPSGATLEFGHMESGDAIYNYQGGAWAFVGVDEATQFTEEMLTYPRTRQRRPAGSTIPIRWRGASNPGGIGHEYVKQRYIKDGKGHSPATHHRQFFPATIDDNPNLDREEYITQLRESGVDPLTLAQLLKGDWDAVAGGRFMRDWFRRYDLGQDYVRLYPVPGEPQVILFRDLLAVFGTVDCASSLKETADYTVISVWALTRNYDLLWLDCYRWRQEVPETVERIKKIYDRWNLDFVGIEAMASNDAVFVQARRKAMAVRPLTPRSKDKLVRATPSIVLASTGKVYLPVGSFAYPDSCPFDVATSEVYVFTGDETKDAHDDIVDTVSYAGLIVTGKQGNVGFTPYVLGS